MLDKNVNNSPHVVLLGAGASLASFKEGDANKKLLPLMNNLIDVLGLNKFLRENGIKYEGRNFEGLYNELSLKKNKYKSVIEIIDEKIFEYFSKLKIPEKPTIYDYLILSLREKDVIATFNWDPLLLQAYVRNNITKNLPKLAFLHGNVGMGVCTEDKILGHIWNRCSKCKKQLNPTKLLYPIKKKNYSINSIVKDQWDLLKNHLKYAYMFTIFGYSAPSTDVDAKELMLNVWKENKSLKLAEVEIIDIKPTIELEKTWDSFTFSHHYQIQNSFFDSYLAKFPRRSCDAFAAQTLICKPWYENNYPKFDNIKELHNWLKPLLDDEEEYKKSKTPFKYKTESFF